MKRFDSSPSCHHFLLKFDTVQHPLLHDVWEELESHNPGLVRHEIFKKHSGKLIPKYVYGTYQRKLCISENPFVFIEGPVNDECQYEEEYEFAIFLEDIYNIEKFVNEHPERLDTERQAAELQATIDDISHLSDIDEIRALKTILAEDVNYLGKYYQGIGLFEIIPDKQKSHDRRTFKDFKSFSNEFIKLTKLALARQGEPDFEFGLTWYDYLATQLQQVVSNIASYFAAEVFSAEKIGSLLQDIYLLAYKFDFSHYEPFNKMVHKGQAGIRKDKSSGVTGSQTRLEKTKDQRKYYLQLCVNWYIKALRNFDSPELPTREINIAFDKWFKAEKETDEKTPVSSDTLHDWRKKAGLDEKEPITPDRIHRCCIAEELDENSIKNVPPANNRCTKPKPDMC